MTSQTLARSTRNGSRTLLLWLGLTAIVAGGITALVAKGNGDKAALVDTYTGAATGLDGWGSSGAAYGWMWAGIVVAALGVVLLVSWLVIRAAKD